MCARTNLARSVRGIVSIVFLCAVSVGCGQQSDDQLYSTAGPEGKLLRFDVRDVNKVTMTVVGLMGTEGCASLARSGLRRQKGRKEKSPDEAASARRGPHSSSSQGYDRTAKAP